MNVYRNVCKRAAGTGIEYVNGYRLGFGSRNFPDLLCPGRDSHQAAPKWHEEGRAQGTLYRVKGGYGTRRVAERHVGTGICAQERRKAKREHDHKRTAKAAWIASSHCLSPNSFFRYKHRGSEKVSQKFIKS